MSQGSEQCATKDLCKNRMSFEGVRGQIICVQKKNFLIFTVYTKNCICRDTFVEVFRQKDVIINCNEKLKKYTKVQNYLCCIFHSIFTIRQFRNKLFLCYNYDSGFYCLSGIVLLKNVETQRMPFLLEKKKNCPKDVQLLAFIFA